MSSSYKIHPDELQRLEDFATDILIIHDRHRRMMQDVAKDNLDISNKLMNIYVNIKSEVRKHKQQEVE